MTFTTPINADPADIVASVEALGERLSLVRDRVGEVIFGQREVVEQALITLLSGGHALLIGVPGLAKTRLVETLGTILGLDDKRIQCTPDLMPADILGSEVLEESETGRRSFRFIPGPVFCQLLMADEINRASPRTQSALLQAMQEGRVSIAGQYHPLPRPFHVLATQNPLEQEGTYPLPEAQLDRFLMKIRIGYPGAEQEAEILQHYQDGFDARELGQLGLVPMESACLGAARREVQAVHVEPGLFRYITSIARRTRDWPSLSLGASPRAAISLLFVAKATAAMDGRDFVIPDDVKAAAPPVLRHRLLLKPEADLEGITADQVIAEILAAVEVPN